MKTRKVDALIQDDKTGEEIFRKDGFEVPEFWSDRAAIICASKYATDSETSVLQIIDRVVDTITDWGIKQGYFGSGRTRQDEEEYAQFSDHLKDILINQRACFNSPVLFNLGVEGHKFQCAACYVLPVEDHMESILKYAHDIGMIFKWGSGCGTNVSKLRGKGESLSYKGSSSGPVSFMRIWDAIGDCVKSGGRTRRAASLICMDVDHPDIMEFIECKAHEERKAKALIAQGISPEEAYSTVRFQNANHSIRVSDEFMRLTEADKLTWKLVNRGDGTETLSTAEDILHRTAEIAWETGDPGVQFHDRINKDNPVPSMGEIRSSNPCFEFNSVDNGSCNLASLNLIKYHDGPNGFNWKLFEEDIKILITAMDIVVAPAHYPTPEIRETTLATRPLGLGFTNLGALLMIVGEPYDSEKARKTASIITRNMTLFAYQQSIRLAEKLGSFPAFEANKEQCMSIAERLTKDPEYVDPAYALRGQIERHGLRNSQLTLLAPTGTISFVMDCDTTGIEPLFALKSIKTLAGGGTIEIRPTCLSKAIKIQSEKHGRLPEAIFKTANEIHWRDHILMMSACQQHLNGAISKTISMSADCTVEDIEKAYKFAWESGLKGVAIYRDGSKDLQPLKAADSEEKQEQEDTLDETWSATRIRLPDTRRSVTHKFSIQGYEGYITVGLYDNGSPGEVWINMNKQGSTLSGILDSFATVLSVALQYGVPLESLIDKFRDTRFEPSGWTTNPDIKFASSIMDYIFRWLELMFGDEVEELDETEEELPDKPQPRVVGMDGPPCIKCNNMTMRSGACWVCTVCGTSNGCG